MDRSVQYHGNKRTDLPLRQVMSRTIHDKKVQVAAELVAKETVEMTLNDFFDLSNYC